MKNLEKILKFLSDHYEFHTAILYGSRAGSDFRVTSDYDFLLVRESGKRIREIIHFEDCCIDLIVDDEDIINRPFDTMYLWQSKVLKDETNFAKKLVDANSKLLSSPPVPLPMNRIKQRKKQVLDELEYVKNDNVLGNFRRHDLMVKLLSLYFVFIQKWDLGDKYSLNWLEKNDLEAYKLFSNAFKPTASYEEMKTLTEFVCSKA
jgi:predicted nucleotidyltransferase